MIRTGFVSNSSSSSFIIAIKDCSNVPEIANAPSWVNKMINKMYEMIAGEGEEIKDVEALQAKFIYDYGYSDSTIEELLEEEGDYLAEKYYNMKAALENGFKIVEIDVDYCDQAKSQMLEALPEKDDGSGLYLLNSNC